MDLIREVYSAYLQDDGVTVVIDCELLLDESYERRFYVVRPGGDTAPHHLALEELINNGTIIPTQQPVITLPVTIDDVIRERSRRLQEGFNYNFNDQRGIHHIGTTNQDMMGWDEVSKFAAALLAIGDTTTVINIVTNTGPTQVTALEWQNILIAAAQFRQPIWAASFYLQSLNSIPTDYQNDQYWQ